MVTLDAFTCTGDVPLRRHAVQAPVLRLALRRLSGNATPFNGSNALLSTIIWLLQFNPPCYKSSVFRVLLICGFSARRPPPKPRCPGAASG
jgi:hypothetical protein